VLDVIRRAELVAESRSTVLLTGETGTGKELVARAIHARSAQRDMPPHDRGTSPLTTLRSAPARPSSFIPLVSRSSGRATTFSSTGRHSRSTSDQHGSAEDSSTASHAPACNRCATRFVLANRGWSLSAPHRVPTVAPGRSTK